MICPHCNKKNYGEVTKCFNCGQEMVDKPGQEMNRAKKKNESKTKAKKRIKMPIPIIIGICVAILGLILTIAPYFLLTATPDDFEKDGSALFANFDKGESVEVRGEITWKEKATDPNLDIWYYELDGDGTYTDPRSKENLMDDGYFRTFVQKSRDDPDMILYSKDTDIGDKGDSVFIEVTVEEEPGSIQRLAVTDSNPFAIKYFLFGPLILLVGAILIIVGFVGKKDTSLDEYLHSNPDLKKGEISISEYQKQQKASQSKPQTAEEMYGPGVQTTPGEVPAQMTPQAGEVSSTNPQAVPPPGQPGAPPPGAPPGQQPIQPPPGQPGMAQPMGQPGAAQPMGQPGAPQPIQPPPGQPGVAQPMGQPGAPPPQQPIQPPPGQPLQQPPQ